MESEFTKEQQIALAIVPKITSAISIGGLMYSVCSFFRSWYKRGKLYHRLFLALTISDLFRSINFFIGTWAVPDSYPNIYMASGNEGTCTAQAVIFQLAQTVPIYLVSMSFYAYVAVKHDFKDLKMGGAEKWIHLVALLVPLLLTTFMVVFNFQGVADGTRCWIADRHWDVKSCPEKDDSCDRDKFSVTFFLQKSIHALCLIFFITIFSKLVLMEKNLRWEKRAVMGKLRHFEQARSCKANHLICLSFSYFLSFCCCFLLNDIMRLTQRVLRNKNEPSFGVILVGTVCMTLSGIVNVLIYFGQVNSSAETVDCAKYSMRQSIKSVASIHIVAGGYKPKKKRRSLNFFNQEKSPEDFGIFMGNDGDDESSSDDSLCRNADTSPEDERTTELIGSIYDET